jgi:hypothetical protein
MLTYVSRFLSGDFEPFWPHVALLSLAVLSSIAVGGGIIFERPKYPPSVHRVAFWLVVGGIAVEAVCTIFLFVFDEGISGAQQSKIIELEIKLQDATMRATSRRLMPGSAEQKELTSVMSKFVGMPVKIMSYGDDHEARTFTIELMRALNRAGLYTPWQFERVTVGEIGFTENGMMIAYGNDDRSKEAASTLANELHDKLNFCLDLPSPRAPERIRKAADGSIPVNAGITTGGSPHCTMRYIRLDCCLTA